MTLKAEAVDFGKLIGKPEIACAIDGEWSLRIRDGNDRTTVIAMSLRELLTLARSNVPHLWKEVDEAAGKATP